MQFEGSEKKIEVVMTPGTQDLRGLGIWDCVVQGAKAKIISKISNAQVDAYLLSESSLFVWANRWLMITCGETHLIAALEVFLGYSNDGLISSLIYERKNEYYPFRQPSDFYKDSKALKRLWPGGKAFRFGEPDGHHLFLFHTQNDYTPDKGDTALEVLTYGPSKSVLDILTQPNGQRIRDLLKMHCLFSDFEIDDFVFKPYGYSLNAIKGASYYTIHVTPQQSGSYVSFESNMLDRRTETINHLIAVLEPKSFDVVGFDPVEIETLQVANYQLKSLVKEDLSCGYKVNHLHFFKPEIKEQRAFEISTEEWKL